VVNRLVDMFVVVLWLVCTTWLISRDAVPRWFARTPPEVASASWLREQGDQFQYGIYGEDGGRRGTCWSVYKVGMHAIIRKDTLMLEELGVIRRLIIDSEMTYLNETELDNVEVEVSGLRERIILRGERQGPQFAFRLKIGDTRPPQDFMLDASAAQTLCDTVKPFSSLRGLRVGQAWKIQMLDPFSLVSDGRRARLKPVVAAVVDRETIKLQGREVECHVVESQGSRAWVDDSGRVLLQTVEMPALGRLEIREQAFQRGQYEDTLRELLGYRAHGSHGH